MTYKVKEAASWLATHELKLIKEFSVVLKRFFTLPKCKGCLAINHSYDIKWRHINGKRS